MFENCEFHRFGVGRMFNRSKLVIVLDGCDVCKDTVIILSEHSLWKTPICGCSLEC